jgi:non-specific protein-tyrosine kinase
VLSVVLAGGIAFFGSSLQTKQYEANATLIVGQSLTAANPDYNQLLASQRMSKTYATIATTRPVVEAVIAKLHLTQSVDELLKVVRASAPLDSTLLTITATDPSPSQAAAIANEFAAQLIHASPGPTGLPGDVQDSVRANLAATQALIDSTQAQVESLAALTDRTAAQDTSLTQLQGRVISLRETYATLLSYLSGSSSNFLAIIEPAEPPLIPVSPRPLLNLVLGSFLGLLIATTIAFVADFLDDSVKTPADVLALLGSSTLGGVARIRRRPGAAPSTLRVVLESPRSAEAEAFRTVRTNIAFSGIDSPVASILVTSAMPGEGKTVSAANLAIVFAQTGQQVLLVDANLRDPRLHDLFAQTNERGLTDLILTDSPDVARVTKATEVANLRLLTAGPLPPNPAELLGSRRMRALFEKLQASCDLMVVDSPPLHVVSDAAVLSSFVDATVVVIHVGQNRRAVIHEAVEALDRAGARILGIILNRVPDRQTVDDRYTSQSAAIDNGAGPRGSPVAERSRDAASAGSIAQPK